MSIEKLNGCPPQRQPRWARPRLSTTWALVLLALTLSVPPPIVGQARPDTTQATRDTTVKRWGWKYHYPNEIETPFMTLRLGGGVLMDYAWYEQDNTSREQRAIDTAPTAPGETIDRPYIPQLSLSAMSEEQVRATRVQQELAPELPAAFKFRDTRFAISGRFNTRRPITYQSGIMWNGTTREWLIRQTGILVAVPELWGHVWIGRAKEGVSLNRVMVGYDGWTMERFTFSDASIPLLADGIKWLGYLPKQHLLWNLGLFADPLSKGQTFSYYERQAALRLAYVRMDADSLKLLHVGVALRIGKPTDDTLQLKSKPESTTAPNFVDTGKFPAKSSGLVGVEAYYRPGNWLFGGEYYLQKADSPESDHPFFHGGDIVTSWLVTGETRPYTTVGGYFRAVAPNEPVFEGGAGALELVLRLSYIDLTSGTLEGGRFWRLTPALNWHLNRYIRVELGYGYGVLDRFGMKGVTQFFQGRLQTVL